MIETRRLKNVVIFIQTILSFALSRKSYEIESDKFFFSSATIIVENVTNICYSSKQIYPLAHQTKYLHVDN